MATNIAVPIYIYRYLSGCYSPKMHRLTDEKLQGTKSAMYAMTEGLACSMELPVARVVLGKCEDISSLAG